MVTYATECSFLAEPFAIFLCASGLFCGVVDVPIVCRHEHRSGV